MRFEPRKRTGSEHWAYELCKGQENTKRTEKAMKAMEGRRGWT